MRQVDFTGKTAYSMDCADSGRGIFYDFMSAMIATALMPILTFGKSGL
uniref:Uncharacterized protein n=1 Tax=Candidatus Kentrum sp. LFY TaxID=2126342 RepID=A0A450U896_9GAMM|nr:MAG: hypothetical protein BECKLFY1418B_GA0070995_100924 [Candidatus Kentron sp. LFY]